MPCVQLANLVPTRRSNARPDARGRGRPHATLSPHLALRLALRAISDPRNDGSLSLSLAPSLLSLGVSLPLRSCLKWKKPCFSFLDRLRAIGVPAPLAVPLLGPLSYPLAAVLDMSGAVGVRPSREGSSSMNRRSRDGARGTSGLSVLRSLGRRPRFICSTPLSSPSSPCGSEPLLVAEAVGDVGAGVVNEWVVVCDEVLALAVGVDGGSDLSEPESFGSRVVVNLNGDSEKLARPCTARTAPGP